MPKPRRYYQGSRPERAQSIEELAHMARRRLPAFAREYVEGGAEDEITMAENRRAFAALGWRPRTLVDVAQVGTRGEILGQSSPYPLAIAPTGYNGMLWPDADIVLARAAHAHELAFTLSTVSCNSIEAVREAVPEARLWFQLYCLDDQAIEDRLLERAAAADYEALVVTTDTVVLGRRNWDTRSYIGPGQLAWGHRLDVARHPRWLYRVLWPNGLPTLGNLLEFLPAGQQSALGAARFIGERMNRSLDWDALARLRRRWSGRLLVKGILDPQDAKCCEQIGADGVILSNHGGRQLDGAPSPLTRLAGIRQSVGAQTTVLLDGGIRRGSDILKAIALGADGVLSGRATLYGLAAAGPAGVERALDLLEQEMETTLALLGCPQIVDLGADWLDLREPDATAPA